MWTTSVPLRRDQRSSMCPGSGLQESKEVGWVGFSMHSGGQKRFDKPRENKLIWSVIKKKDA
jgi:hypothetical protein